MDDVTVAIPWRPAAGRQRAFERVCDFWWNEAGFPIITAPSSSGPFNRSEARNMAVAKVKTPVVIVADADVIPELPVVQEALRTLEGEVVWLYDEYRIISAHWAYDPALVHIRRAPRHTCFCGQMLPNCCGAVSGLFACRTETYWRLGGHDERFGGKWGGEDVAFAQAAGTLTGARRVPGLAVAFDHPSSRDIGGMSFWAQAYESATAWPHTMENLVADPRRGHAATGVASYKQLWGSPEPVRFPPRPEGVTWV